VTDPYRTLGVVSEAPPETDLLEVIGKLAVRIVTAGGKRPEDAYMHEDDFKWMVDRLFAKVTKGDVGQADHVKVHTAVGTIKVSIDPDIRRGTVHVGERRS
jgi:hypothetical protein